MSGAKKRMRLDAEMRRLLEERLKKKDDKSRTRAGPRLPLKNDSGSMELGWVRNWEEHVRELLERNRELYLALQALVEGHPEQVTEQQLRDLREEGYLARDLKPLPGVQAIIQAAARETPDGPCVVDPLDVRTEDTAKAVQKFDQQSEVRRERRMARIARRLLDEDEDRSR